MEKEEKTMEIMRWISMVRDYAASSKHDKMKSILKTTDKFTELYCTLKKQQPYHINVIDELHANENAHSRILRGLLMQKTVNEYEIFRSFANELLSDFKIEINNPEITAEIKRIDLLIKEIGKYAIILENKINFADFQPNQFANYIDKMRDEDYAINQIYVVYAPPFDYRDIPDHCWELNQESKYKNDECNSYKERFKERFITLTFKEEILHWLENNILPNCRMKDIYLQSAITQYIDHLKGKFNIRTINNKMNMELQEFLKEELKFDNNPVSNLSKVNDKINEVNEVSNQLNELKKRTIESVFIEWEEKLKKIYKDEVWYNGRDGEPQVGVLREYNGKKFAVYIEYKNDIVFGASKCDGDSSKIEDIIKLLSQIWSNVFDCNHVWWYVYWHTSFKDGYQKLVDLIEKIDEKIKTTTL